MDEFIYCNETKIIKDIQMTGVDKVQLENVVVNRTLGEQKMLRKLDFAIHLY